MAYCADDGFLVSKETVVLRRWERWKQNFGFIKRVDKTKLLRTSLLSVQLSLDTVDVKIYEVALCHCNSNLIHCFNGLNNNNQIQTLTLINKKKRNSFKTAISGKKCKMYATITVCQFPNKEEHWPYDIAGGILPKVPNYQPVILRFTFFPFFGW